MKQSNIYLTPKIFKTEFGKRYSISAEIKMAIELNRMLVCLQSLEFIKEP